MGAVLSDWQYCAMAAHEVPGVPCAWLIVIKAHHAAVQLACARPSSGMFSNLRCASTQLRTITRQWQQAVHGRHLVVWHVTAAAALRVAALLTAIVCTSFMAHAAARRQAAARAVQRGPAQLRRRRAARSAARQPRRHRRRQRRRSSSRTGRSSCLCTHRACLTGPVSNPTRFNEG